MSTSSMSLLLNGLKLLRKGLDIFLNGEGVGKGVLLFLRGGGQKTIFNPGHWYKEMQAFIQSGPHQLPKRMTNISNTNASSPLSLSKMAELISILYSIVSNLAPTNHGLVEKNLPILGELKLDRLSPWRRHVLSRFIESASLLSHYCSGYFLIGSAADGNMAASYSDVDTLMIIQNEVLSCPKTLMELRFHTVDLLRYFYAIDPLQHHGHLFITEEELSFYSQRFLPLATWREAVPITNSHKITIREVEDYDRNLDSLNNMVKMSQYWCSHGLPRNDLFSLKSVTSLIQLFPVVYMQSMGHFLTKREAFELAQADFSEQLWESMRRVTKVREHWPRPPKMLRLLRPYFLRLPSPWATYYLGRAIYRKIPNYIFEILGSDFPVHFNELVEEAIKRVKKS